MDKTASFGVARDIITPCVPTTMMGFGSVFGKTFTDIHDDLYVRALLLQDSRGAQVLLLSFDLLFFEDGLTLRLREHANKRHGLPREHLHLSCTHTHYGPSLRGYDLYFHSEEYEEFLFTRAAQCIDRAFLNMRRGTVDYGFVDGEWNISRRLPTPEGMKFLPNPDGDADKRLYLLRLADEDGVTRALLLNFACHPSNLNRYRSISSEYPGRLCAQLEQRFYGATAIFFQGAGADIKLRLGARGSAFDPISYDECNEVAAGMAQRVQEVLLRGRLSPVPLRLGASAFQIPLPLEAYPREFYEAVLRESSGRGDAPFTKDFPPDTPLPLHWSCADHVLKHFDELEHTLLLSCGVVQLNRDFHIFIMGGEPVTDVRRVLAAVNPGGEMLFFGYANAVAYIPSDKAIEEGGYEADGSVAEYRLPGRIAPGVDRLFLQEYGRRVGLLREQTAE